jgi:hypothetical protein
MQIQGVWLRSRALPAFGPISALQKNALWQYLTSAVPERSELSTIGQPPILTPVARYTAPPTQSLPPRPL